MLVTNMNYATIKEMDIANGTGIRVSLFVSGCSFHCKGCFNKEAQNYGYGQVFDEDVYNHLTLLINKPFISGLSVLGGDAMWICQKNPVEARKIVKLCEYTHTIGKNVWLWTGFTYEQMFEVNDCYKTEIKTMRDLFSACDVVIDGQFIEEQKDISLKWRGSKNQRILNVKECLKQHRAVMLKDKN